MPGPRPSHLRGHRYFCVFARSCRQKRFWNPTGFALEHIMQNYESRLPEHYLIVELN